MKLYHMSPVVAMVAIMIVVSIIVIAGMAAALNWCKKYLATPFLCMPTA
jgi:hypothetical protein